jgi:uncharacterized DUF497 family protein
MGKADMVFEWDPEKAAKNIAGRRPPFELAEFILADPNVTHEIDNRKNYGEVRRIAYGKVGELCLRLTYTIRGENDEICRVITLYQIHEKDWRKHYGKND